MSAVLEMDELQKEVPPDVQVEMGKMLDKSILLLGVYIHRWRGQYKVKGAEVTVNDHPVDEEAIASVNWNLCPDLWKKKFAVVDRMIDMAVAQFSVDVANLHFPLKGVRIVSRRNFTELIKRLNEIERDHLMPVAVEFAAAFPDIVQKLLDTTAGPARDQLKLILNVAPGEIIKRFRVEKVVVPVKFGKTNDFEEWAVPEAEEALGYAKESGRNLGNVVAAAVVSGLQNELRDSVDNLRDRINAKGVVKGANLEAVKTAFNKLKAFSFANTPEMLDKMDEVEQILKSNTHTTMNEAIKNQNVKIVGQLVGALQDVREQVEKDLVVTTVFRTPGRRGIRT